MVILNVSVMHVSSLRYGDRATDHVLKTDLIYFLKLAESFYFTLMIKRVFKELKLKAVSLNFFKCIISSMSYFVQMTLKKAEREILA